MELPSLRHFANQGIFYISSDPVEALVGEAWVAAIYTDKGWATADGASLLTGIEEWRNGEETKQSGEEDQQGNERVQSGDTAKRQARPRQRAKSEKQKAGDSNCTI
jgi:hypothetical protein